jgi:hypothetical protein
MGGEVIFLGGRAVPGFALGEPTWLGDGSVGDLLAFREEWEPYIAAHLALWQKMNDLFEGAPAASNCPTGTDDSTINPNLSPGEHAFCASLLQTRRAISYTDPGGIPYQWNAWRGKTSSEILNGADSMLKQQQSVVEWVSGPMKDTLVKLGQFWKIAIELPDVPSFADQSHVIARIEGAWISLKGVVQMFGYAAGETVKKVGSWAEATAEGLSETVRAIPKAIGSPWTWVGVAAVIAVVGAGLVVWYVPRRKES